MYWPSVQELIFKWKTKQLMALLDYLIWQDNGLYYLQSWLQEKFYHFVCIYDKKQTPFSPFFSAKWEVIFFPKKVRINIAPRSPHCECITFTAMFFFSYLKCTCVCLHVYRHTHVHNHVCIWTTVQLPRCWIIKTRNNLYKHIVFEHETVVEKIDVTEP